MFLLFLYIFRRIKKNSSCRLYTLLSRFHYYKHWKKKESTTTRLETRHGGKRRGTRAKKFTLFVTFLLALAPLPSLHFEIFQFPSEHVVEAGIHSSARRESVQIHPSFFITHCNSVSANNARSKAADNSRKRAKGNRTHSNNEIWNYMCTHSTFNGVIRRVKYVRNVDNAYGGWKFFITFFFLYSKITRATEQASQQHNKNRMKMKMRQINLLKGETESETYILILFWWLWALTHLIYELYGGELRHRNGIINLRNTHTSEFRKKKMLSWIHSTEAVNYEFNITQRFLSLSLSCSNARKLKKFMLLRFRCHKIAFICFSTMIWRVRGTGWWDASALFSRWWEETVCVSISLEFMEFPWGNFCTPMKWMKKKTLFYSRSGSASSFQFHFTSAREWDDLCASFIFYHPRVKLQFILMKASERVIIRVGNLQRDAVKKVETQIHRKEITLKVFQGGFS